MDVLTLLDRARAAGLTVAANGDKWIVHGPKTAEALVRELGARKAEVLAVLAAEPISPDCRHYSGPTPPCPQCGGPTHDALDHLPGIVVLLCDDAERCRWGLAMSAREFAGWIAGPRPE